MKAKRILSLLLSVAMVATIISALGVTAFAAPSTNPDYVLSWKTGEYYDTAKVEAQKLHAEAVKNDANEIKADITVEGKTNAELKAMFSGIVITPAMKDGKGWLLTINLSNLGTLVKEYNTEYGMYVGGYTMNQWGFRMVPQNSANVLVPKNSVISPVGSQVGKADGNAVLAWAARGFDDAYPVSTNANQKLENASMEIKMVVFADEGTVLKIDGAGVQFVNYNVNADWELKPLTADEDETAREPFMVRQIPVWTAETITLANAPTTKEYDVTFAWNGGSATQKVEEGKAAAAPADPAAYEEDGYRYTFKEWDADFSNITAATTINAVYTQTAIIGGGEVAEGDKNGTAIIGTDKKYDNSFAVSSSFTKPSDFAITKVGVLFIPATVLGSNDLTIVTPSVVAAEKDDAFLGTGTISIKAAIRAIPRDLEGRNIEMVTRPFFVANGEYTYGTAKTTTLNFASTGEVE